MSDDGFDEAPGPISRMVRDPAALGVASLVMGGLSLSGSGLLSGSMYVLPFTAGQAPTVRIVLAGLVGAVLAVVAVALGARAWRRVGPGDPEWVPRLAQAGMLVSAIAVALRLIATVASAAQLDGYGLMWPL